VIIDANFFVVGEAKPKRPLAYWIGLYGVLGLYVAAVIAELMVGFAAS
jgi:hypothetical protein